MPWNEAFEIITRRRGPLRSVSLPVAGVVLVALVAGVRVAVPQATPQWRQWGGPHRNFMVQAGDLADSWPEGGPPELWRRPLGEGHSTIIVDDGRLYTLYRPRPEGMARGEWSDEEVVVALDAATGDTLWEHRYPSSVLNFRFGAGPHSSPLVVGERVFTTGSNKQLFALDKRTGEVLWSHDLVAEFDAPRTLIRPSVTAGFACSPLQYGDTIIVTAGGPGRSVMAFDQSDGSVIWSSGDFLIAPSSPILIDVQGQLQLVVVGGQTVNGLDPDTGAILWSHPHDTDGDMNNSTAVWGNDSALFVSSSYNGGSRVLDLERTDEGTAVTERFFTSDMKIMFGSTVRLGDLVYGTSGAFGPSPVTALDLRTGELAWQQRGFARGSLVHADGKTFLLDEDGVLALLRVSPDGMEVLSQAQVMEGVAWTAPSIVGTTMYLRDRRQVVALDLGRGRP